MISYIGMKEIPLTQGLVALVSDWRYEYLIQWNWTAFKSTKSTTIYAVRRENQGNKRIRIFMHREIMNAPTDMEVDHKDGDGLNNQDENLRIATHQQNGRNRKVFKNNKSGCPGVIWSNEAQKWRAYITVNGKQINLKCFSDISDAIDARKRAEKQYFGEFVREI